MGNDPVNLVDPTGGFVAPAIVQAVTAFLGKGTLPMVTVVASKKVVTTASKIGLALLGSSQRIAAAASNLAWNISGFFSAVADNALNTNFTEYNKPSSNESYEAIANWNAGVKGGNAASIALAVLEGRTGEGMISGGGAALATAPASGPAAGYQAAAGSLSVLYGLILEVHSFYFFGRAVNNTLSGRGLVKYEPINIPQENKIPRDQLNPPTTPGNAPTFKKDGKPVEIHHEGQNPNGPFREMHPNDHRGKGNDKVNHPFKGQPSKIDRGEFKLQKEDYWKKEFPGDK
jgi:hypothetical protein